VTTTFGQLVPGAGKVPDADREFRQSVDAIKKVLAGGGIHWFKRRVGATTAILEMIHELGTDQYILFTNNLWNYIYGSDFPQLRVRLMSFPEDMYVLRGCAPGLSVFIDGFSQMGTEEFRNRLLEELKMMQVFYTGVK
jgi:hypothetical protein